MTTLALDTRIAVTPPSRRALAHIPGDDGWPIIGSTFEAIRDPKRFFATRAARHGPVVRSNILGETGLQLLGPAANELVLLDTQRLFSSHLGWGRFMDRVFPRGLMMLDFDEHRLHRRALSVAFKAGPMRGYLAALDRGIAARVADWRARPGPMLVYPAMKQLTLDLAAGAFLGAAIGPETDAVQRAFKAMVAATIAPVRAPLPGTAMRRGVRGRAHIVAYFGRQIPLRREGAGDDLFSHLCRATDEDGALLSVQSVIDHMSFLMMAAHDTLTSSLTAFVWLLATNPAWQTRLRDEVRGIDPGDGIVTPERLEAMKLTEMALKEALRIIPPVPAVPRRALRDFEFAGYAIPAGTAVGVDPLYTHHMPDIWPEPETFDPLRFTDAAQAGRHRFAHVPFGGGAHMCLGLHFAYMQAKCFAWHLLRQVSVAAAPGYVAQWKMWPIPRPRDGLQISVAPA